MTHPNEVRACPRCGIRRVVKNTRPSEGLCRDCRDVDPEYGQPITVQRARERYGRAVA